MKKCFIEWSLSPLYVYSMNPSQYRAGRNGIFLRKDDSSDITLDIYIVLFIYDTVCAHTVQLGY